MGKGFKGKACVYCVSGLSTAPDHVFARELFLPEDRANLPKVPACDACNGQKSALEHYVATLLPFGGRHSRAARNLAEMAPKRLAKNARLHRSLRTGMKRMWAEQSGILIPTTTVPIDPERLLTLFEFIGRGLAAFHWQVVLGPNTVVRALALTTAGEHQFDRVLAIPSNALVMNSLGNGTVTYEGTQDAASPETTAWRVKIYGGAAFADPDRPGHVSRGFGILTVPKDSLQAA